MQSDLAFSYSARLLKPFLALLVQPNECGPQHDAQRAVRDPDERVPIQSVHAWLAAAIEQTRDPDLGVRAGALMTPGEAGVIDYVLDSADTVADALEVTGRYMRLLNDAADCRLEVDGNRVVFRMDMRVATPPAAEDFMLTGFYTSHRWLRSIPSLEFWFRHPPPHSPLEYRRVFASTSCRFHAPCSGVSFSRVYLQQRLERADPNLHSVTRRLADIMLGELPPESALFSDRVRALIARELANSGLCTSWVAQRLRMSPRTLARRLESENTTFFAVLDQARRERAMRLIEDPTLSLTEIAFVLGFAHVPSFHRAFRRWTGMTPASFRHGQTARSSIA